MPTKGNTNFAWVQHFIQTPRAAKDGGLRAVLLVRNHVQHRGEGGAVLAERLEEEETEDDRRKDELEGHALRIL